ncbi:MAG: epoxyqueuosine reductase QueH [Dehalococcoidia bacterium]|nr:epoxyqueuosine reductase QueH [Dehalococcoidia bacterium]
MKLLVHACCAHCTAYTIEYWRKQGHAVTAVWYNPNIHHFTEHNLRLEAMSGMALALSFQLVVIAGYDFKEYFRRVAGDEADRCRHCFDMRLDRVAAKAAEDGFEAFTTSLLISPHQKHELVNQSGEKASARSGVAFLSADLRKRYSDSRRITKPLELYRQQYCGCIYSEVERYTEWS